MSVTFNGLALGIFAGDLQFTAYKGSNLLRQEAIAKTEEPSVAYIYKAGLKGFAIADDTKLVGATLRGCGRSTSSAARRTRSRSTCARATALRFSMPGAGSLAVFPPPHKFFFARENEVNLGYVYYRKDSGTSFSLGVMQPERGEGYAPWGVSDEEWKRRVGTSREQVDNYALYNAPPGTLQHMAVYYYLSPKGDHATQQAVLAYTHDDVFKPVPGFKVVTGHFHLDFNEMLRDRGPWTISPAGFRSSAASASTSSISATSTTTPTRAIPAPSASWKRRSTSKARSALSDKNFLVIPAEEPNAYLGGHWYLMPPKPIYFSHAAPRPADQPFEENDPTYGHVYHLGSSDDVLNMVNQEQGIIWTAHPRTKSSEGIPRLTRTRTSS